MHWLIIMFHLHAPVTSPIEIVSADIPRAQCEADEKVLNQKSDDEHSDRIYFCTSDTDIIKIIGIARDTQRKDAERLGKPK